MPATDPWVHVLAEFGRRLDEQERVVELAEIGRLGDPDAVLALAAFVAPTGLPPCPLQLVAEAQRLAERSTDVTKRLDVLIAGHRPTRPARSNWARQRGAPSGSTDLDVRA